MLSPNVRAAAEKHAEATRWRVGGIVWPELISTYETGYCAGVRAPRAHRFPLAGDAAFKRLLGQYLAENITVYHPATGRYGLLRGLPGCYEGQGEPLADVEFYADELAREEGGGDLVEPYGKLLPVLYALTQLPELLPTLPEDLQKQIGGLSSPFIAEEAVGRVIAWIENWARRIDMLRTAGFAVGLAPHQYHRRVAGFDYATGGRPEQCAGCERKEVCRG